MVSIDDNTVTSTRGDTLETKIIKAVFDGDRYAVTAKRTRTDYGQVLEFVDVVLPDTFECIFSNSAASSGVGKKQIGSAQRVLIPDEYLATGQAIYAWVLVHDGDDDGRHMYNVKIPVVGMPDTSPEEPTPVEQSVISQAITALNSAVTATTQKAQEASASADRAEHAAEGVEGYAERAESAQQAAESARDRATQAETSARTSAATASEKASEAISSATTASQSALTAEGASENAHASADASYQNAQTAYRYAQDSATSAGQAESYASGAGIYASDAQTHSQTASQKASEAAQSASTAVQAKTDAESAKTASQTAQTASESARDGAVSAKTDAESARDEAQDIVDGITGKVEQIDSNTERIESLEDDRYKPYPTDIVSGSIASFPDGADDIPLKSCIVRVEPVQDLHGYDSPWPAGGGKNKFNPSSILVGTYNESTNVWAIPNATTGKALDATFEANTQYTFSGTATQTVESKNVRLQIVYTDNTTTNLWATNATTPTAFSVTSTSRKSISEIRMTFGNAGGGVNIDHLQIESGSTATSYAPYENICPISGFTGVEVQRTGKNLIDIPNGTQTVNGVTAIVEGGVITLTGTATARAVIVFLRNISIPAGTYRLNGAQQTMPPSMYLNFSPGNATAVSETASIYDPEFTLTEPTTGNQLAYLMIDIASGINTDGMVFKPMIRKSNEAESYEPYSGQTYNITFPSEAGTVYGAKLYPLEGKALINRAIVDVVVNGDNGVMNGNQQIAFTAPGKKGGLTNFVSNLFKNSVGAYGMTGRVSTAVVEFRVPLDVLNVTASDSSATRMAAFAEWLSNNPTQLCYELAEPIEIQLSENQIDSLYGQNNIWSDCGDTEVEYRADTTLYINKKIAEAISALS